VKQVYNGISILINQGAASFNMWTGLQMQVETIRQNIFVESEAPMKNTATP
ncbi:shikimate dehydrogenase, partial [Lacticaseibacillus rhamnosus]